MPCVVQFTNGENRTLNKYSKIERTICKCANLDKGETFKLANGRGVCALCSTNVFLQAESWPRGVSRGFAAARLLGLRVRILPGTWISLL